MTWDIAGLGNALMDALVVIEDDGLLTDLDLVRGTMHLVEHDRWQEVYEKVRHHKVTFDSGGSCANTIATAGLLGGQCVYAGQVGDDQMGHMYADRMEHACGHHALRFTRQGHTGKCLSIISQSDAERTMLTNLGAAVSLPELGSFAGALQNTKVAHFTGYTFFDGPMLDVVMKALDVAKASGALISLDVADPGVIAAIKDRMWDIIDRYVDVVFLNAEEARQLTGLEPEEAVHAVAQNAKVQTVVVKLGKHGSLVRHHDELYRVDARMVKAVDTTGAGDSYAGGYLYGLIRGWSPDRSGALASAVAALTVSQVGAVVKDREALQRILAEFEPA